ncbi:MAG TPA: hypothetical protein VN231_02400 [Allosphingosinicella sp.]|nr:hypothetical protein [Allosphingosinicella sp.]
MTGPALRSWRPAYLAFLPGFLFAAEGSKPGYVAKAWLLALLPSLALAALVSLAAPQSAAPRLESGGPLFLLLVVLVAPFLETLLMIGPLWLLDRLLGPGPAAVGSALLWGLLHSLAAPAWGLVVWWPFLILSIVFLTWRALGLGTAVLLVTSVHAMQNCVAAALPLLFGPAG